MPRSVPYKESNNRFATKWMKNALKSVGITSKEVLTDIAPNTSEIVFTGANISRDVFGVLTRNRQSMDRIHTALSQNKYSRALQSAYKNALSDIKSGNLNNQDRMMQTFGGDEGGGFSFGDDDQQVQIDTGTSAALSNLGNQMAENTTAQIKMMKASTDAMISASAASMFQNKQIGSEIISKLNNINNQLASLVEFNNTNMSKYIESSIAYMERTGSAIAPTEEEKKKLGIHDVLRGNAGFDTKNYKKYVVQQFKEYFSGTTIGMVNEMLTPEALNLLAANPIGFIGKSLIPKLMPAMMSESLKAVESSFNDFLPQALMNLYSNATKTTATGIMGELIRGIGETFGLKPNDRSGHGNFNLKEAKIERGPIPFDGETKHAITTIITKELRDQTSYLRVIAEHFDKKANEKANGYKTYWDWNTNSYVSRSGVDKTIATTFTDAIAEAFDNTTFGKTLREYANTRSDKADQKRMNDAITQLYTFIERTGNNNSLNINEMEKLIGKLSIDTNGKKLLLKQLNDLYTNNNLGYYSARTGKLAAGNAISRTRERILENPNNYNLIDSSFNREMTPEEFDKLIDASMGYNEHDKSKTNRYNGTNVPVSSIGNMVGKYGKNIITQGSDYAVKAMLALATGNSQALKGIASNIVGSVGNVLKDTLTDLGTKASNILFGTKNEQTGNREDGLFSAVINETKDAFFGKPDAEGKREGGIIGGIKHTFDLGLTGWMEAFFDRKEGETDEEMKKRLKGEIESRMPGVAKGALGGALVGGILGHPFIGAALGGAAGFMSKSETFQNWLFGDIDPDHPEKGRTGGIISREIQDYFKNNKKDLAKNTGVGAAAGGVMGMLVGGPLTGAMLGAATGLISKTGMFQRFLFGDEKTGHKGLINGVKEAFGKGSSKYSDSELKSIGMKGIGAVSGAAFASFASAHGLLGAMMFPGGPVGGAIAGLALTIKAQEGSIKEWLFGKKDKDGKIEKTGVLGTIANNINTAIINPLKTELKFHIGNLFNRIEHHVLTPISLLSQFVAKRTVDLFKTGTGLLSSLATAPFKLLNKILGGRLMDLGKGAIGLAGGIAGAAGRALSAPGRAIMSVLGAVDPDLYAQGLGAKASFRENREAIRQARKADRRFDKIDREISKATKGRYGEDTPEARDYIRRHNPRLYRKLFFDNGNEIESRKDVENKANIEKEGRRLSQLFAKGDKGKVNVNAMSIEERQTYYMYKQTEYLRRILGNQEKEEEDHEDFNPLGNLLGSERSANTYGHNAGLINETYDRLIDNTRGTGIKGAIQRRMLKMQRKAQLRRAANRAFNEPDSDSAIGRTGYSVLNKFKNIFSGQGGRGAEEDDDYNRWLKDQNKNKYDKNGKTAEEIKKEKEEKEHNEHIEATLAVIAENTGGINELVEQEDGSKKKGIFGALKNLVSGFGGMFGKKGVFGLAAVALAPLAIKMLPTIIKGLPGFIDKAKQVLTWLKDELWEKHLKGIFNNINEFINNFHTGDDNDVTDEDGDGIDDNMHTRGFTNRENHRSLFGQAKYELDHFYDLYDEDGTIRNSTLPKARLLQVIGRKMALSPYRIGFESSGSKFIKGTTNGVRATGNFIGNYFGNAEKAGNKIFNRAERLLKSGAINADDYAKLAGETVSKYGSKSSKLGQTAIDTAYSLLQNGTIGVDEYNDIISKVSKDAASHFDDVHAGQSAILNAQKMVQAGTMSADDYTKLVAKTTTELGDNAIEGGSRFARSGIGKGLSKAGTGIKNMASSVGTKLTTNSNGNKTLLGKVLGFLDDIFNGITTKAAGVISKITGSKAAQAGSKVGSVVSGFTKGLKKVVTNYFDDIALKINTILGTKLTGAAISAGLTEVAFVTFGAINGATGAAKLFHVDKDSVDGTMVAISSIFGGISQTLPGAIADVCIQLYASVTSTDILSEIATGIYNIIMRLTGQDENIKNLDNARKDFKEQYLANRENEIREQYEAQLAAGIIPANTTWLDFCRGVEDGTYQVKYDSEVDYNTKVNASLADKVMSTLGSAWKTARNSKIGNAILGKKAQTVYTSSKTGKKYTKGTDGMYYETNEKGEQIGSGIYEDALSQSEDFEMSEIGEKAGLLKTAIGGLFKGIGLVGKGVGSTLGKITNGIIGVVKLGAKLSTLTAKGDTAEIFKLDVGESFNNGNEETDINPVLRAALMPFKFFALINSVPMKIINAIGGSIGKSIGGMLDSFKASFANVGDDLDAINKATIANNIKDIWNVGDTNNITGENKELGLISKAIIGISKIFGTFKVIIGKVVEKLSPLSKGISDAVDNVKDSWNTSTVGNLINTFFLGEDKANALKDNSTKNLQDKNANINNTGGSGRFGGRGVYYSQNDPSLKNIAYGTDGATLGDSGCGPAALGMAMSDVTGNRIPPTALAHLAEMTGDRDSTGTNANFISKASNMVGLGTKQALAPSARYLANELSQGNEVVLLGRNGGYGGRGSSGLFTDQGHYIVATGMDRNGNVSYKDSLHGIGTTNINRIAPDVGMSWSFGGNGYIPSSVDTSALENTSTTPKFNPTGNITTDTNTKNAGWIGNRTIDTSGSQSSNYRPTMSTPTATTPSNNWIGNRTIDTSDSQSSNYRPNSAYAPEDRYKGSAEYQRWINTITYVKNYASNKDGTYDQGGYVTVVTEDGTEIKMRRDCSGFVSACLIAYGALANGNILNSRLFTAKDNSQMLKTGFIPMGWPGWDNLIAGDIIARNGHVEIFAENSGNSHKVWNWGSNSSASESGTTYSSHPNYTTVWRHPEANGNAYLADIGNPDNINGYMSTGNGPNDGSISMNGATKTKKSPWSKLLSGIGNFFSAFFDKAISGDWTGVKREEFDEDLMNNTDSATFGSYTNGTTAVSENSTVDENGNLITGTPDSEIRPIGNIQDAYATLEGLGLNADKTEFFRRILPGTLQSKSDDKVRPSITMAQAALESGWGKSGLTKKYNNLFGMKAGKSWTGKTADMMTQEADSSGNYYSTSASWRVYPTWDDSVLDHGKLLGTRDRYRGVINATSWEEATDALGKSGYATAPDYGTKIANTIAANKLYAFDNFDPKYADETAAASVYHGPGSDTDYISGVNNTPTTPSIASVGDLKKLDYAGMGGSGYGGRGTSINRSGSVPGVKNNMYISNNNTVVSKAGGFGIHKGVSKTIKQYSIGEKEVSDIINYLKLIFENTGLSANKLDNLKDLAGNTNNNIIMGGNSQAPLTNYSTKADNTANAKSLKSYQTAAKMATGGIC